MIFDPFSDRLARDIRNSLSSALITELSGIDEDSLSSIVNHWAEKAAAMPYQDYINKRLMLYRRAIGAIRAEGMTDPRYQAICLWNLGLYFEMHELLETVWRGTRGPERAALKGWIQAAGVFIHYQRGKKETALSLARRAEKHLRRGRAALGFIANLDQVIEAVADPAGNAPQMIPIPTFQETGPMK